jgi:hypothetical protein
VTNSKTGRQLPLFGRWLIAATTGWAGAALLVIAVLLLCNITLLVGRHTGRWDASDFFCPYFMLIADHARHGELLLWTPLLECGCPAGFDPEIGALSPVTVGVAALLGPNERAFCAYWLMIWGGAGLGVLLLARHYRAPRWLACAAAIGTMFSAVFTGEAEYTAYLVVMAVLPWTLWRLEAALETRRLWPAAEAGALWGAAALSGYPAMIIIGTCYLGLWMLGRMGCNKKSAIGFAPWKNLGIAVVFVAISVASLAPAYFGFLHELRGYSDRSGAVPRGQAIDADALSPKALATFASPYLAFVGTRKETQLWSAHTDIAMCSIYLTPPLCLLALAGLCMKPRDTFRWWVAGLGALCLAASVGSVLPVRAWLYDALPPMRYFRHAAMFRCFFTFSVVAVAILSARDLTEKLAECGDRYWKRLAALACGSAVAAAAAFLAVYVAARSGIDEPYFMLFAAIHVLLIWGGMAALTLFAWKKTWISRASFSRRLLALCILDAVLTVFLSKPTLYSNRPKMWPAVEAAYSGSLDLTPRGLARQASRSIGPLSPRNACLVSKTPVFSAFNPLHNRWYDEMRSRPALVAAALGDDRIWFAPKASLEPLDENIMQRFAARSEALGSPCIIVSDPAETDPGLAAADAEPMPYGEASLERLPAAVRRPVRVRRYDDRHLEFDVACPEDGWLLVTDRWAPSWQAWVNDVPQRSWIGNMVFRAVPVPQGENRVRFQYDPLGYPWSVAGSWLTLALVAVGSVWTVVGRGKKKRMREREAGRKE